MTARAAPVWKRSFVPPVEGFVCVECAVILDGSRPIEWKEGNAACTIRHVECDTDWPSGWEVAPFPKPDP